MKVFAVLLLFPVVLFISCASNKDTSSSGSFKKKGNTGLMLHDAEEALKAFDASFYNPDQKLYYHTTDHATLAAIWTQAIYYEMIMDAYERTKEIVYLNRIDEIFKGGYKEYAGYDWNNKKVWFIYDDMMWWINALARAYQITGNKTYLEHAEAGFRRVWNSGYDKERGGMFWQFTHKAKNACINYPTVIAALRLYQATSKSFYLLQAKNIYRWSRKNLFDTTSGRVADHKMLNGGKGWEDYTYNQGTCIGAAVMLYKMTDSTYYLEDAKRAADYTKNKMCNAAGILPAEGSWNEQGVLKTIFAHYMMLLVEDCGQDQYVPWLRKNTHTAWKNRDTVRNITFRDYTVPCPDGTVSSYDASSAVELMLVSVGLK